MWLALVLAAVNSLDAPATRLEPRLRLDVAGVGLLRASRTGTGGGVGAAFDLGAVFDDVWCPWVHVEATVFFGARFSFTAGGGADVALSDLVSVGAGLEYSGWTTGLTDATDAFVGATFPLRLRVAFRSRAPEEVSRTGVVLGFTLAPGFTETLQRGEAGNPLPPGFGVRGTVSVGVSTW